MCRLQKSCFVRSPTHRTAGPYRCIASADASVAARPASHNFSSSNRCRTSWPSGVFAGRRCHCCCSRLQRVASRHPRQQARPWRRITSPSLRRPGGRRSATPHRHHSGSPHQTPCRSASHRCILPRRNRRSSTCCRAIDWSSWPRSRSCRTPSPSTSTPMAACMSSRCAATCPICRARERISPWGASSSWRTRTATAGWTSPPSSWTASCCRVP